MPVISSACGTGSPPHPSAAPRRAIGAEQQEHAVADHVEREDLAQRLRVDDQAVDAEPDQRRRAQPEQRRRVSSLAARSGAPARIRASVSASEGSSAHSMTMISGFARPSG